MQEAQRQKDKIENKPHLKKNYKVDCKISLGYEDNVLEMAAEKLKSMGEIKSHFIAKTSGKVTLIMKSKHGRS